MYCNQCGHENRNDRKFCSECGAPLRDYTKERENLIMPEDLKKETANTEKYNKTISALTKASVILLLVACVLLVLSFFITNEAVQIADLIACLALLVAYFIVIGVKRHKTSKRTKELSEAESKNTESEKKD